MQHSDAALRGPSAHLLVVCEELRRAHNQLGKLAGQVLGQLRIDPLALRSGQMECLPRVSLAEGEGTHWRAGVYPVKLRGRHSLQRGRGNGFERWDGSSAGMVGMDHEDTRTGSFMTAPEHAHRRSLPQVRSVGWVKVHGHSETPG